MNPKAKKRSRTLFLSIAVFAVMFTGCSGSDNSNIPAEITEDLTSATSAENSADEFAFAIEAVTESDKAALEKSASTEESTEKTTNVLTETMTEETTTTQAETAAADADGTEVTFAELTAPVPPDTSGDIIQLDLDNVKESYDISYGSEIACAALVLNYLGFNVDEAELASYLPPVDDTLSYIPSSAIESAIEDYLSDIGVQEYEIVKCHIVQNYEYEYGYPSIVWLTPSASQSTQCFVLIGKSYSSDEVNLDFYDPYDNVTKNYTYDDFSILDDEDNLVIKRKE